MPVIFTQISKPVLTYNSRNKIYAISCNIFDNNNIPYIYQIYFKYDNNDINLLKANLICLMAPNTYKSIDIYNDEHNYLFNFNHLTMGSNVDKNLTEMCLEFYELYHSTRNL